MSKKNRKKENKKNLKISKNENPLGYGFFVIPLILLIFAFALALSIMQDEAYIYVSPIFKNYKPLEKSQDDAPLENYFKDESGLFYDEEWRGRINDSVEYLYEKTGVRVFLLTDYLKEDGKGNLILPTDKEAKEMCKSAYDELNKEGVDVVMLFIPTTLSFEVWTYSSDEVKEEFGSKFERVLKQYIEYNYHVAGEYDDLFIYSYRDTADRIMGGFTSPIKLIGENLRVCILTLITVLILVPSIVIYRRAGKKR